LRSGEGVWGWGYRKCELFTAKITPSAIAEIAAKFALSRSELPFFASKMLQNSEEITESCPLWGSAKK
jgi:hypothetical protein